MGKIRDFFKRFFGANGEKRKVMQTIINKYYGGNINWFAYNTQVIFTIFRRCEPP